MPSHLKKLVRDRMNKTGESHQQALRHVRSQATTNTVGVAGPPPLGLPAQYYDARGQWFPLGRDGDWLAEELWERNLRVLRNRHDGVAALAALRSVFTPRWSREQRGTENLHPVVYDQITFGGRHHLLEIGFALTQMREKARARDRLLAPKEYKGTCAELRCGLWLRAAGAAPDWEPISDATGPDWSAKWPEGSIAVETKRPRTSKRASELTEIENNFFFEVVRAVSDPPLDSNVGAWLTLHLNEAVVSAKTPLGSTDVDAIHQLANETAEAIRRNMPTPVTPGVFSAGRAGEFSIEIRPGADTQVQFSMRSSTNVDTHDAQRVFEIIQKAATQLGAMPEVPGLIVLDAEADFMLLNHLGGIAETMGTEAWAENLAGVAIVTQSTSSDDDIGESRIDTILRIVPGPKVESLSATLLPRLRVCEQGHFHVDILLDPAKRCRLIW